MNPLISIIMDYFYLRQRIPILLYLYYTKFKEKEVPEDKNVIQLTLFMISLVIMGGIMGLMFRVPLPKIIPLNWHYAALLTWATFFLIYYTTALRAHLNELTAFTLSTLATVGGGWLYEIPFFHPIQMFVGYNAIFYFNGQIICLLLLAYELHKMGLKMNMKILLAGYFYLMFSGILFINWRLMARALGVFYIWIYRLPTCIFLLSLLSGVNGK